VTVIGPDEVIAAHERIEARQHVGKVVVDLARDSAPNRAAPPAGRLPHIAPPEAAA